MRLLPFAAATVIGFTVLTAGCSTIDKAQGCLEASKVVTDIGAKIAAVADDPEAMDKALKDSAAKLEDMAGTAGNTTLNEALQNLADSFKKLDINDAKDALDAAEQVASDTAKTVTTFAQECT